MKVPAGLLVALGLAACTAVSAPAPATERTVPSADGVRIAFELAGEGETALVFVHGWCCDRAFWRATLADFAGSMSVVALDLAGHGASGAGRENWNLSALARDVVAVVEALDLRRVVLVGHSMGGPVACLAAPLLRPRVLGVIGVDCLHDADFAYPPGYLERVAAELEADFPRAMERAIRSVVPARTEPELVEWILARALRTDRTAAVALLRGLEGFDLAATLAAVDVPVRVVNAAPATEAMLVTDVAGNSRLADFDALLLDGVGHFPMLERPDEFRALLRRWVDELGTREAREEHAPDRSLEPEQDAASSIPARPLS
jgi:pimeloyl-ACP methyl ester carboxylesterase